MSNVGNADDREMAVARSVARDVAAQAAVYPFAKKDDPRRAERELGAFAFQWVLATLQKMGVLREPGETYEPGELERRLGVAPKYGRYFAALIRRLEEQGWVTVDGQTVTATEKVRAGALDNLGEIEEQVAAFKKRFVKRYPACAGLFGFMARCLGRFDEILTGRVDAADVLFQDGGMDVFAEVFRGDVVSDYFNRLAAEAVRTAVVRRRAGSGAPKVRIVEVGAGTGGTTAAILEALQPLSEAVEFCFTDISQSFLRYARRRFAEHPWLDYRTLDIEKDLPRQGFDLHGFDVVAAANVLHDTRDIEVTLEQVGKLLKPGGLLILNEFTAVKDCLFFSGALLHGYWLFEDPDRRLPDTCLLDVPRWEKALAKTGFTLLESFVLPTQSTAAEHSQSVMLCAAGGEAAASLEPRAEAEKAGIIGRHVQEDILALLGQERAAAYSTGRPLMEMGLDSIELVELKSSLRGRYGVKLPPAFLFEHATQEKIVKALEPLVSDSRLGDLPPEEAPREIPRAAAAPSVAGQDGIAIVGASCRLAGGATSPEAFWKLLERGGDGIGTLPEGRWEWPPFIDVEGRHKGIDQGGFLPRIDELDARFFRISPREAELMDPQQRLLLELSWEVLEDAGHRPSELAGHKVGVFVGVCQSDYRDVLVAAAESAEAYVGSGTAYAMLANRLSYFYDFKGPSVTVDTACSSSLVALHDAVAALRRGDCEEALVGGVNLLCSPTISVSYYQAGMLSPTGRCRTFDAGADGYVRGEGGVMLLLKPLARALADGDAVYGLIRGTAVNHGGQAASLTAPKPEAQAEVVESAWRQAEVPADSVGYVEAHGTGTPLGDPIEVSGLTEAFRRLYLAQGKSWPAQPFCALGSVKSNLGHLEGAAGVAGLLKILLSMEHGQIPRTLHVERLNPEIELAGSPFYIAERTAPWPRFRDGEGLELPRRASVSSFGFGGANAHAALEELPRSFAEGAAAAGPFLIPLSARSREELTERARQLMAHVERLDGGGGARERPAGGPVEGVVEELRALLQRRFGLGEECTPGLEWEDLGWGAGEIRRFLAAIEEERGLRLPPRSLTEHPSLLALAGHIAGPADSSRAAAAASPAAGPRLERLEDVAFTLQAGREPMKARAAFVAESWDELRAALRGFLAGGAPPVAPESPTPSPARRRLAELAARWTEGAEVDWMQLYPAARPRRVHLPTYPFVRERFWVSRSVEPLPAASLLHPLLHRNTSDLAEQRFSAVFTGHEPFLADHRFEGRRLLPGVAYLEMAREAMARSGGEGGGSVRLRNVVWLRPFVVEEEPAEIHLGLYPEKTGEIEFEAYSGSPEAGGGEVIHAQGVAVFAPGANGAAPPRLDLSAIAARCRETFTADVCYATYAALGLEYGAAHRGIESLRVGTGEVLAELALPAVVRAARDRFVLHPSLMDAAVQALIGFTLAEGSGNGNGLRRFLPFEVRDVEIFASCEPRMRAVVRRSDAAAGGAKIERFDIDLCDEAGSVAVRFRGLSTRSTQREAEDRPVVKPVAPAAAARLEAGDLQRKVQTALAPAIVRLLKLRDSHVQPDALFSSLGFDSITFADFARALNHDYSLGLTPTVFFEYPTLERFSHHLAEEHQAVMAAHLAPHQEARPAVVPMTAVVPVAAAVRSRRSRFTAAPRPAAAQAPAASAQEPIAIVGISGRFPMAKDVDEFWDNLVSGRDCITEIPPERWDWKEIWGDPRDEGNRTNVKWGGFIEGVDEFDPLFFNISPREARVMDPQQRLLMLHVWKAIEDAGYSPASLSGSQTAIFVGAGLTDYDFVLAEPSVTIEDYMAIGTAPSVGPHRMSYFLDLHGPSEPIETACSSSLVAVHRAVCAMRSGQCEMAIVGGVGTLLTPHRQIAYSKAGMLSPDGRCKTFSSRANGYVRGEGVGMLFLKKLGAAEEAGDHIWGVIRGSSENHGGRANSLTAPNPKAQAELLKRAYREADVEPESVSYIEAHGTGTELGDPIEVDGLKAAFRELYRERGTQPTAASCGLGSVKTNIGHLEVAAGVAGIIKVLLQMKHRTLAPSLHCDPPNPYVQLDGTPFFVVREAMEWRTGRDGRGGELPRRAGVSSFSVSGANAHVVIEEYVPRARQQSRPASPERPVAVVLSARNEERLRERAEGLLAALRKNRWDDGDLIDVAYTLQVGREAMDARFGAVAGSTAELEEKLVSFLAGGAGQNGFYQGAARGNAEALAMLTADEDFREVVDKWIDQGRAGKVLDLWVKGLKVDWERFYAGEAKPRRVSLPTYPFARDRYWVKGAKRETPAAAVASLPAAVPAAGARRAGPEASEMVLTPTWEPAEIERLSAAEEIPTGAVAVTGGTEEQRAAILERQPAARLLPIAPGDGVEQMREAIAAWGEVGHIVWIVPPHNPESMADDSLLAGREGGVLFGFRLIKALLAEGYGEKPLAWSVITTEAQAVHAGDLASPAHAAVHGLIGTMAKELSLWPVRLVDMPSAGEWPWRDLATLAADPHGNAWAWRDRRWYRQQLAPCRPAADGSSPYRSGGVYVVLGGAGGIGEAWSEAVLSRVPARIVWIGRRPIDATIQARIDRLALLGPAPLYIAADATDRGALEAARDRIKSELGRIDGVIHSAMALHDRSLANMEEDAFLSGLASKVDISVRLAQVFAGEALDFVLFFSSIASFLKWPGQCNYVAGGAFEDAFAGRLAAAWPCRVRVINWGYWSIGGLDSEKYRAIMARKGLASIELPGAMRMLDVLLTGPVRQLAYLAALGPGALDGASLRATEWAAGEEEARRAEREKLAASAARMALGTLVRNEDEAKPREITTEQVTADLRARVAATLGVDPAILDSRARPFTEALLGEFGMDSLSSNSLRNLLRRELGVDIPVHLIIGEKVESIIGALYEQLLLQQVSKEPRHEVDEETETFVF